MDGRGHRFAGPAMSMGATFFDEDFNFDLEGDEGFEAMAAMLKDWLDAGLVPAESWASGDTYVDAREYMFNVQSPMHFSGSWQIGAYASTIGDDFDWVVVPNPTGPGGSTGVMGGAALVAFETGDETQSEATTRVMEYLLQPEVYAEFSGRTLNIPAHAGAVEVGVEYDTDDERVAAALAQFSAEAAKLEDHAITLTLHPWNFVYYSSANTRLSQYFTGELTVEEAVAAIQADIDDAVANAESS